MAVYSPHHKYIFFANPQTGSKAIAKTLTDSLGGQPMPEKEVRRGGEVIVKAHHASYPQLIEAGLMTPEQLAGLFKFTGVRNPYDLLVSRYLKRRGRFVNEPEKYRWAHENPKVKASMQAAQALEFPEWIAGQLGRLAEKNRTAKGLFEYLDHADLVIRFEALQQGFDTFLERIGVSEPLSVVSFNVTAERGAATPGGPAAPGNPDAPGAAAEPAAAPAKRHYTEFYDAASRALVARVYGPVIERFGYQFGEGTTP